MVNAFVIKLLDISAVSCFVTVAVLVLRLVFKKAPAYIRCLLWVLVGLRLVLPISIESEFSLIPTDKPVSSYIETAETDSKTPPKTENQLPTVVFPPVTEDSPITQAPPATEDFPITQTPPVIEDYPIIQEPPATQAPIKPVQKKSPVEWERIFFYVWITGSVFMLGYMALSYLWMRKMVRGAFLYDNATRVFNGTSSPFVLGMIKPTVYMPSKFKGEEFDCILAHEKAHIARGDHVYKPFAFILLAVYWFNPLVWVSYILFCKDIELACDERVIAGMTTEERKQYSLTLISCAAKRFRLSAPLAFGEVGIKERVKNIMNYKKPSFWIIIIAIIAAVFTAALFITSPSSKDGAKEESSTEESSQIISEDESEEEYTGFVETIKKIEWVQEGESTDDGVRFTDKTVKGNLTKISFSTKVTDFKYLIVNSTEKGKVAFDVLFTIDTLPAEKPFYVNIVSSGGDAYSPSITRAVEFINANGAKEQYYIHQIPMPSGYIPDDFDPLRLVFSPVYHLADTTVTAEYVSFTESSDIELLFEDTEKNDELIRISADNTVTEFKFLSVSWDKNATPTFETLYTLDRLKSEKSLYIKTSLAKEGGLTGATRAIEYVNSVGKRVRFYLLTQKTEATDRFPYVIYLQAVTGYQFSVKTHATAERLKVGGSIESGILFKDSKEHLDLIKISVNKTVTDFKFLSVNWNENAKPTFETLFSAGTVTPNTPFYAQTFIERDTSLTSVDRAIEYKEMGGKTKRFYISAYNTQGGDLYYDPEGSYHWSFRLTETIESAEWNHPSEIMLYVPAETAYELKIVKDNYLSSPADPDEIINALTKGNKGAVLPEGTKVNFFHVINNVIHIDLNKAFAEYVGIDGLSEYNGIGSVVNTLLGYYGGESVYITVDGKPLMGSDGKAVSMPLGFYGHEKNTAMYVYSLGYQRFYKYTVGFDGTPQGLVDVMIEAEELKEGVKINSLSVKDGVLQVDFNNVFYHQALGVSEEDLRAVMLTLSECFDPNGTAGTAEISINGEEYRSIIFGR